MNYYKDFMKKNNLQEAFFQLISRRNYAIGYDLFTKEHTFPKSNSNDWKRR
jgi:hypothetical protein